MKQEQEEIAQVLSSLGMDEQLIHFMTGTDVHREKTRYEKE